MHQNESTPTLSQRACSLYSPKILPLLLSSLLVSCASQPSAPPNSSISLNARPEYPPAQRLDVTDNYHGTTVPDPYRWLEDPNSEQTHEFVAAQNKLFREFVDGPTREHLKARLTELANYPRTSAPSHEGERWTYSHNDGLQAQSLTFAQQSPDGPAHVLLDPNTLSADGTVAVGETVYSHDGQLVAYGINVGGSDQMTIKVRRVDSATDLPDELKWCRFSSVAWNPDGTGFWYNRYPTPGTVPPEQEQRHNKLFYHHLGDAQDQDQMIYDPGDPDLDIGVSVTDDGKYLVAELNRGTSNKNRLYYRRLDEHPSPTGNFTKLFDNEDASYSLIHDDGNVLFIDTDLNAPHRHVIAIDLGRHSTKLSKTIIPESEDTLGEVMAINNGNFVAVYDHDAHQIMKLFRQDGTYVKDIALPTLGSVGVSRAQPADTRMYFTFTSFTVAPETLSYDFASGQTDVFHAAQIKFDPAPYMTEQVFFRSKDGTRVPMFITRRKDMKFDGSNPTIVSGYGGFNISLGPSFSSSRIAWLEQGGILVQVTLRGGSEYGEK